MENISEYKQINNNTQHLVVFFIFFALLIGCLFRGINKSTKIPYAPMLIVFGILISNYRSYLGIIGQSLLLISNINPHMILLIFIPVLIFEAAFNIDWFVFKRTLKNILILSVPGVFIQSIMFAICIKIFLNHDEISIYGSLAMGSILCATDSVAIVDLLKELGASVRFNTLFQGESLLNNGTAMVFYQVFINLDKGKSFNFFDVIFNFTYVSIGGPIFGLLMGILGSYWIRRIIRDDVVTCMVSFVICYICFFLAEYTFLGVSGILAVFILGLFMSANGKTQIRPQSEQSVYTVWSFAQYGCETLIFILAGVLIGINVIEQSTIENWDWVRLAFLWVFLVSIRYFMFMGFLPVLQKNGYQISQDEVYLLVWGGLRGALGLTISLIVLVDEEIQSSRLKQITVFYMAGISTITLVINGTTCGILVEYLNVIEFPGIRRKILQNSIKDMVSACDEKMKQLKTYQFLEMADWEKVEKISGLMEIKTQNIQQEDVVQSQRRSTYGGFEKNEILTEIRFRLLRSLKSLYWEYYENGQISGNAVKLLQEGINIALENTQNELKQLWDLIYINFTNFSTLEIMFAINNWFIIGGFAKTYITHHLTFVFEVVQTFIICSKEIEEIQNFLPLRKDFIEKVNQELQFGVIQAQKYLAELSNNFPQILKSIHTKRAACSIIEYQKKFLLHYKSNGYIDDQDYKQYLKKIEKKGVRLENMSFDWSLPTFQSILLQFPIFSLLSPLQLQSLQNNQMIKNFKQGEEIYTKGQPFKSIYIISKGTVKEIITKDFWISVGIGGFLSYAHCVCENDDFSFCSAVALTDVMVSCIPFSIIQGIIRQNREFEQKIYVKAMIYFVKVYQEQAGPLKMMNENTLFEYCENAKFLVLEKGEEIVCEFGGYLITGGVKKNQEIEEIQDFTYLQPSILKIQVNKNSYLIKFQTLINLRTSYLGYFYQIFNVLYFIYFYRDSMQKINNTEQELQNVITIQQQF
ncbi:sodium hydrogen exchanger family protein, putative [Ichthyophthirius multifiliis]|uniref:Sodium hydrogen exchanger family protein, putative n=1 Tax=Ichthyophthirius multifiliis TaxID=5932 RepID=G0QT19_ICHMU|nr:sodium hydrogen exchanger family protein, putative [Ichthyophthirius multifiliis]EGR31636.1 sodium hydrogen exchanger family protein, putative [Ichthyophthirius multifiliis]|eukprot:XP_004035122.1 sodium hydrogen exchanger family protein, putative [Ichthyophthirius multifiliis]